MTIDQLFQALLGNQTRIAEAIESLTDAVKNAPAQAIVAPVESAVKRTTRKKKGETHEDAQTEPVSGETTAPDVPANGGDASGADLGAAGGAGVRGDGATGGAAGADISLTPAPAPAPAPAGGGFVSEKGDLLPAYSTAPPDEQFAFLLDTALPYMAHPMVRAELFSALAKFGLSTPLGRLDNPRTPGEQYLATAPEVRVELVTCVLRAIAATAQA